ncbi:MAG: c-type cytochrome [Mesorhizobium sp.]|nr:c-type cytochrome [Mesorhizobium sp.]
MDSFELNKLLGALLGAIFIVFSVSLISDTIFYSPTPATPGYVIEVPEQEVADEGPVEDGPNVLALIADGDVAAGEAAFRRCTSCHTPEEGGANRVGPNLWDPVMTPIAAAEGFNYSSAMREFAAAEEVWTYEHLAGFLENPRGYVPGTTMSFAGIRDVQEKADLIAFLRTLSNDPAPLPEVEDVSADEEAAPADGEAAPADGEAATEEDAPVDGDESGSPAEPVEPTPATDGTEASPETDAGVPASDSATDEPTQDEQAEEPAAPAEAETGEPEAVEPETVQPETDETDTEVEADEELEEELPQ